MEAPTPAQLYKANELRTAWRINHDRSHTDRERHLLAVSGLYCLPEASEKLAAFGVIPLTDTVRHPESSDALRLAKRAPSDDAHSN